MSVLLLPACFLLAVVAACVLLAAPGRLAGDAAAPLRAAHRHEQLTALASLIGIVCAPVLLVAGTSTSLLHLGSPGLVSALSLAVGALLFLTVHAVGELTWPQPAGQVRQASLRPRTVRGIAGPRGVVLAVTSVLTAVSLAVFGLTATDSGRAVPHLITPEAAAQGSVGGAAGPYPGWVYGLPLLAAFAVVLLVTWLVLQLVARRPAVAGTSDLEDHALRRTSAARILGGVQLLLGGTLAAVLLVAANALHNAGWALAGTILLPLSLFVGITSVISAAAAVRRVPSTAAGPAARMSR